LRRTTSGSAAFTQARQFRRRLAQRILQVLAIPVHPCEFRPQCSELAITFLRSFLELGPLLDDTRQFLSKLIRAAFIGRRVAHLCECGHFLLQRRNPSLQLLVLAPDGFDFYARRQLLDFRCRGSLRTKFTFDGAKANLARLSQVIIRHRITVDTHAVCGTKIMDSVVIAFQNQLSVKS
jgi:hypothetical protein